MNRYASDYAQYQPSSSTNSASGSRSFLDNSTYLGVPSRQSYQMGSQDRSGNGNSLHYTTNPSSSEPSVLFPPPPPPNASAARSTSVSIASSHMISTTSAPVYQIDFTAKEIGKRIASSKRRISWRYGFPNQRALEQGHTGMACRGLEHEVVLIWSVTSGKRTILEDNREVVYSLSRGAKFEHSWTTREGMVIKLIAYDFIDNSPTGLQYDLLIHGQSFFKVNLGLALSQFSLFVYLSVQRRPLLSCPLFIFTSLIHSFPKFMSLVLL